MLHLDELDDGGWVIVRLNGELDASTVVGFRDRLAGVSSHDVILDLSGVGFMDSSGLGAVIGALRRVRQSGGDIVLASPRPPLRRLLHTAGIHRIVRIVDSVEDALADVPAPPAVSGT